MGAVEDPAAAAAAAGLTYVSVGDPGIVRRRRGRGFSYERAGSRRVSVADRERIDALAIPPAWTDVWICGDPEGHIQAAGRDAEGRLQYRYHDDWTAARAADKFSQLGRLGGRLGRLRRRVDADLEVPSGCPLDRTQAVALAVRLLDETLVRVGNPSSAQRGSFGLVTLRPDHVDVDDEEVTLEFVGKGGADIEVRFEDPLVAELVERCAALRGPGLLSYEEDGDLHRVTSEQVNQYLHDRWAPTASAHDFRAWGASASVAGTLGPDEPLEGERDEASRFLAAVDVAAERLGNTRALCRSAYVHPDLEEAASSGELHAAWQRSRRGSRLDRAERTLLRVLGT